MFKKSIFLIIILIVFSISLKAQEDSSMTNSRTRLRKAIKEKLMEKLNIDGATADKVIKLSNEQRKIISEYAKEKRQTIKYIEDNPDAGDIMAKINGLLEIDDKINKSRKDFLEELKTILTPKQIAQSIIFQKNLRKLFLKENRKER
jgi:hypothetical protein